MYIYLAHPIDQAGDAPARVALNRVISRIWEAARQQGHWLFRPVRAHQGPQPPWDSDDMTKVHAINQAALFEADGLIAILMPGVPTLGTPTEIMSALDSNKPTLILTTGQLRATSVQIADWVKRGANCMLVGQDGDLQDINLAEGLCSMPDPSRLFSAEPVSTPAPPMQVRYTGSEQTLRKGRYAGDAGVDLAIVQDEPLAAGEYRMLPTGAHVAIPEGYFGLITGRSSTWANYRCDVRQAIIDSGYRGELMVGVENHGSGSVVFEAGMRLAQLILLPVWSGAIEVTDKLPEHERGEAGYGSSGR